MAVAAYASLLSLNRVLDHLQYRAPFHLPLLDINLVQKLERTVPFLLEFVDLHHLETETPEVLDLWRHLTKLAFEAEERVNSHVVDLLGSRSLWQTGVVGISDFCDDLERMISKFHFITKHLQMEINEACKTPATIVPAVAAPSTTFSSGKSVVVGFDEHVSRIMERLTGYIGHLQLLSIVGMGGIGKTTLARCVYDHPYIVDYFDIRIWVKISQEFSVQQILVSLLATLVNEGTSKTSPDVLRERLHKELYGRRYLIVMDDMWSTEAWDELRRCFPDNVNSSHILVTTRISNVAACLSSLAQYPLSFLSEDASWDLFCLTTFEQNGCPHAELEEIGREIVKSCRGLPVEISVIGRSLANSDMTREYWEVVGENVSSFGNLEDNEHCLKLLSLSYKSLPLHLKPCFLYLRVFREHENIHDLTLINSWIAKGFVKPTSDKTLEEIAKQYLDDLISRSLMIKNEDEGKITFSVHGLLWDLCVRESNKESFIQSPKVIGAGSDQTACQVVTAFGFQRDLEKEETLEFPTEVRNLYLDGEYSHFVIHKTIHLLWNLEVLNISLVGSSPILLPSEIWEMPKLRDIAILPCAILASPIARQTGENHFIILKNLGAISRLRNFECTKEVADRIPNLKHLKMCYEIDESTDGSMVQPHNSLCNIAQLQKLESLVVENALENITFPNSLQTLVLVKCRMAWEDLSIIGSLPFLERLELLGGMEGSEWNPVEGEFAQLQNLFISDTSLKWWRADSIHFPRLEKLHLWHLPSLEEIPLDIGDIPSLEFIHVKYCSVSAEISAKKIREEQWELGNETLNVVVVSTRQGLGWD